MCLWRCSSVFIVCFLAGCGYTFAGRGYLPQDIRTLAIPVFTNRIQETGIENIFTSALVEEFTRTGRVKVVDEARADAILKGAITSYTVAPIFYSQDGRIRRYRVTVSIDAELVRNEHSQSANREMLWQVKGLAENEDYDGLPEILSTKAKEREAVEKIARDLMEEVHDRVFESCLLYTSDAADE